MDKMSKAVYDKKELLYKYKESAEDDSDCVEVGALEMIDDILTISKCKEVTTVELNAEVNSFVENKKLKLGETKCARIHVGKNKDQCSKVFVHDNEMKNSDAEKYLGDRINYTGKHKETIEERKNKGYGIVSQIMALTKELPLGRLKIKVGLMLREAWLINSILLNTEVWGSIPKEDIRKLEVVENFLLRSILGLHSKTPTEHLYLETGALPIPQVMKIRRLCYLQTVLEREKTEITRKIYESQKNGSCKGD